MRQLEKGIHYRPSFDVLCTPAEIARVSSILGLRWKCLARELGLSPTDIGCIYSDNHDLRDQIHSMFTEWKRRKGNDATLNSLRSALERAGIHVHAEQDENKQLVDGKWGIGEDEEEGGG